MNIQKCEPQKVRQTYKYRLITSFAIGGGVFLVLFSPMVFLINPLVSALIAFFAGFGVYYYLESRLLVITCPQCSNDINTNTPWHCGFKGCHNENVDEYPFVRECEKCHFIPKAYECHHCGHIIPLTSDPQRAQAAKRLVIKKDPIKTVKVVVDPTKDKELQQKVELRDLTHERDAELLKHEIKTIKKKPTSPPPASSEIQAMRDRIRKGIEEGRALNELEREELEKARSECKGDEELLPETEADIKELIFLEKERLRNKRFNLPG